jgi:hypothetical protein
MTYCEGVKNWLRCICCEHLYSSDCPVQRGDIEELIKVMNLEQPSEFDLYLDEMELDDYEGPTGQA